MLTLKDKFPYGQPTEKEMELIYHETTKSGCEIFIISHGNGYPTAYIGMTDEFPAYDLPADDIDLPVHGGVTYTDFVLPMPVQADKQMYYVGWDYAHCGDMMKLSGITMPGKEWTIAEIVKEAYDAIDELCKKDS